MSRDEWRITSAAIEMEMERIAGLLQKSAHFQNKIGSPTSRRDVVVQRPEAELTPEHTPDLVHKR